MRSEGFRVEGWEFGSSRQACLCGWRAGFPAEADTCRQLFNPDQEKPKSEHCEGEGFGHFSPGRRLRTEIACDLPAPVPRAGNATAVRITSSVRFHPVLPLTLRSILSVRGLCPTRIENLCSACMNTHQTYLRVRAQPPIRGSGVRSLSRAA